MCLNDGEAPVFAKNRQTAPKNIQTRGSTEACFSRLDIDGGFEKKNDCPIRIWTGSEPFLTPLTQRLERQCAGNFHQKPKNFPIESRCQGFYAQKRQD